MSSKAESVLLQEGTTTSEIGFECPRLGLTRTELTRRKRGKFGDSSALFCIQQGMSCLNTKKLVPKQASEVEVKEIRRK